MSVQGKQLDPEIAHLLREIPRYQGLAILADSQTDLRHARSFSSAGPFRATRAERHLLEAYREEVAWLLRQASLRALLDDPGSMLGRCVGVDERIDVLSEPQLRAGAEQCRHSPAYQTDQDLASAVELLPGMGPVRLWDARRTATASLDLVARDDTRICLAVAMVQDRRIVAAELLLREVIAGCPLAIDGAIAWNNMGSIHIAKGDLPRARDAFRRGLELAPYPAAAISWLLQACKLGDEADALRAACHLDDLLPADHPALEEHIRCRLTRPAELPSAFPATARRLRDRVGSTARRVLDA